MKNRKKGKSNKPAGNTLSPRVAEAARLYGQSRFQEVLQLTGEALGHQPDDAMLWNLSAAAAYALGYLDDAEQFWRTAVAKQPEFAEAHHNLGVLLFQRERLDEAEAAFRLVMALSPDHAMALNNLGAILMKTGRKQEAVSVIKQSLAIAPDNALAYNNIAIIYGELQQYDEAMASFNKAIALKPDLAAAFSGRGLLSMEKGARDEAERDLNAAIRADPHLAEAYFNLSLLDTPQAEAPWVKQMESVYPRRDALSAAQRCYLEFAMGKVLESLGRYDEAFAAYRTGNELFYRESAFDEAADEHWFTDTMARFTAGLFAQPADAAGAVAADQRVPVFIVGMARSGTTLIEQILASHPDLYGAGELTVFDEVVQGVQLPPPDSPDWEPLRPQLRALGQAYLDRVWAFSPNSRYISDKLPGNFRHLGLLHLMLPNAKIVHCLRDPMDACVSCYTMHFRVGHEYAYDLGTLGRYHLRYRRLMEHWQRVLPPGTILDLRYEDMIDNPEREARRLMAYMGLPWDPACLRFYENKRAVSTASLTQVRKQIYSSSQGRWRRFEKQLSPLLEILGQAP